MFDKHAARREIEKRDRLHTKAKLALVSVEGELRRYEQVTAQKECDDFVSSSQRIRVREKFLNAVTRKRNDPNCRPFRML